MRKPEYDKILFNALERMSLNPENYTLVDKKIEAFETVLRETDANKLIRYYANMDEFFGANNTDITNLDPDYLLKHELRTGEPEEVEAEVIEEETEE